MALRVAVVGCGAIAEIGHIPAAIRSRVTVDLRALVDCDRGRADALAARFGIPLTASSLGAVAGEVDAAILATPPHVRPSLAEEAFNAGLHVLCEKPLANSGAEARKIVVAAERASRVLSVGHTYRFFPNRVRVHEFVQQGQLGSIETVDVEQGSPSDWPTRSGYSMRQDLITGGVLLNEGIHALDTLFWWFGCPETLAYEDDSLGGLESNARISMRFAHGVTASCRFSRTCQLKNEIRVEGTRGSITLEVYDASRIRVRRGKELEILEVGAESADFVNVLAAQLIDFAASIDSARPPRVTGDDGVRVVSFIERCYAAKRSRPLPTLAPIPGLTW
jgi:predicted dehydrogenase